MAKLTISDEGVFEPSTIFGHVPSAFARSALFYPLFSGNYHCNEQYRIIRKYREMFLLIYVLRGQMKCEFENSQWTVNANQLIWMDCKQTHQYYSTSAHTQFLWIHFSGNSCQPYYEKIKAENRKRLLVDSPEETLTIHFHSLLKMMEKEFLDEQNASIYLHSILRCVDRHHDVKKEVMHSTISRAMSFIHTNYAADLSVDQMADQFGISKHYFIRLFKAETGFTPYEYLQHIRIRHAMERLSNLTIPIEQVAQSCGYNNSSHFARSFKNHTGSSPSQYRRYFSDDLITE